MQTAIRLKRRASYDQVAAVLDTDIPWTPILKKEAQDQNIILIGNSPCIEALFLRLLDLQVPEQTAECKKALQAALNKDLLDRKSYEEWCSKKMLDKFSVVDKELSRLLSLYKG